MTSCHPTLFFDDDDDKKDHHLNERDNDVVIPTNKKVKDGCWSKDAGVDDDDGICPNDPHGRGRN